MFIPLNNTDILMRRKIASRMSSSPIKLNISARYLAPVVLALVLVGAAACSTVLDDVGGFFEDDQANDRNLTQDDGETDFPKLSKVPDTPRPASSPEDLDQLTGGLVADRDEARYTNETLRSHYADDDLEDQEPQSFLPASTVEPVRKQVFELEPGEFANQQLVSATDSASEPVLRELRAADQNGNVTAKAGASKITKIESEQMMQSETRFALVSESGVIPINEFRALFNERFNSSGSLTYRKANVPQLPDQVEQGSVLSEKLLSSGTADLVPTPLSANSLGDSGASTSTAVVSFQAASIPFSSGSSTLNSSGRAALKQVVRLHREFGGHVRVIGHASRRTRDMDLNSHSWVNFQISLDRATAVSMELTRLGVPALAVLVDARSDNEPVSYEYMPAGEAENRRADVFIEF